MELKTERLRLREFVREDWAAVRAYQDEPNYLRFYDGAQRTEGDARAFVQMFLDQQAAQPRAKFQFALILKADGRLIGNCGVRVNDVARREASIGYELNSRYWGCGYATEAAREIVRFGFETLSLRRLWAECLAENTASARVLQKIGMHQEAHFREKEWIKDRWHDQLIYAILEREWRTDFDKIEAGRKPFGKIADAGACGRGQRDGL